MLVGKFSVTNLPKLSGEYSISTSESYCLSIFVADACRSKEESHPSCKTNDEKSSAKKENSSLETAKGMNTETVIW